MLYMQSVPVDGVALQIVTVSSNEESSRTLYLCSTKGQTHSLLKLTYDVKSKRLHQEASVDM